MSTEKHTPGPWAVCSPALVVRDETGEHIVDCSALSENGVSNARLIAAAPDLLEALQYIVGWKPTEWSGEKARELALAAISKATGGSNE